jgi:DNA repair protein SbcC/Rad50
MLINSVKLASFRGIPGELEFNFDRPLNIIYAPNGTGKTSLLDSIEWLFTAKVSRLHDSEDIVCKLATEARSFVEVETNIQGFKMLRRSVEGSSNILRVNNRTSLNLLELYHQIFSHQIKRNSDGDELFRATYLINPESVNLLLDEDSASNRSKLFANVLGTENYQKDLKDLKTRLDYFRSLNTLDRNIEEKSSSLKSKEQEIESKKEELSKSIINSSILNSIARLKAALEIDDELSETHTEIEMYHLILEKNSKSIKELSESNVSLEQCREDYVQILKDRNLADVSNDSFDDLPEKIKKVKAESLFSDESISKQMRAISSLQDSKNELYERFEKYFLLKNNISSLLSEDELSKKIYDLKVEIERLEKIIEIIDEFNSAEYFSRLESEKSIDAEIKETSKNLLAELEALVIKHKELSLELENKQSQIEQTKKDLQSLFQIGQKIINEDTMACPLCNNDQFAKKGELKGILDLNLSRLSEHSKEIGEWELQKSQLKFKIDQENKQRNFIKDKKRELDLLKSDIEVDQQQILKIFDNQFPKDFSDEILDARQKDVFTAINECKQDLGVLQTQEEFQSLSNLIQQSLAHINSDFQCDLNLGSIEDIHHLKKHLESLLNKAKRDLKSTENELFDLQQEDDKLQQLLNLQAKENAIIEKLTAIGFWQKLSVEALTSFHYSLLDKIHKVKALKIDIEDLARLIKEKEDDDSNQVLLEKLKQDRDSLKRELTYLENEKKFVSKLTEEIAELEQFISDRSSNTIMPLKRLIESLYLRSQANHYIKAIDIQTDNNELKWLANIGDAAQENNLSSTSLSQGQRQDLALSIFLARAISKREGTYFLDEPFAHLDDLNRTAVLDIYRTLAIKSVRDFDSKLKLVITTANENIVSHLKQKLSPVGWKDYLKIFTLSGNPQIGVKVVSDPN